MNAERTANVRKACAEFVGMAAQFYEVPEYSCALPACSRGSPTMMGIWAAWAYSVGEDRNPIHSKWVKGRQDRLDALVSATWTK